MKSLFFLCLVLFMDSNSVLAQDDLLTDGAELLFREVNSNLSNSSKNQIFELTEFSVASNGSQFHFEGEGNEEFPFSVFIYPVDLNKDGMEEIAIQFGNAFTSGMTGASYYLMVPDDENSYHRNFGLPGFLSISEERNLNYPDIVVGGPGFMPYPVWRWNGEEYAFHQKIEREIADNSTLIMISDASASYQETQKH
ncbi:MAG: hypothetical protein KJO23_08620 [Bacteroidia bacterium]|nr:hypothetical protein [Bacteroidia bacterium]NNM22781.1 hypothetical protein [Flavobacteriaceae bacterium]